NRIFNTEIRLATTSAMEHQREPPATGERNPVSGANDLGPVFVAERLHRRCSSDTGRVYLGLAKRTSSASVCRSAVPAAHDRTCTCQPLRDRWRTDRLHRS